MKAKKELTYGLALAELNELLNEMERGLIGIDELIEKARRATFLLNFCKEKLRHTEAEIQSVFGQ